MKILSGVYQRDDGEIILFGNKIGEWDANKAKMQVCPLSIRN